jgi:L-ascorbate metabolism protein UlaG (beta-lactamase superfamily)
MPDIASRQAQIEKRREEVIADYPRRWSHIIDQWKETRGDDRAYLTYSANYLFCTNGTRWAIDPLTLKRRLAAAQCVDIADALSSLEFVLLTHEHNDHLDTALIYTLKDAPIRWVVPREILSLVTRATGLSEKKIIVPENLKPISLGNIQVVPFEGLHWESAMKDGVEGLKGLPATSYLVEFRDKRWLFPGDVRTYDIDAMPGFGPVDGVFAHLWLGRKSALMEPPPLVNAFCDFYASLRPKRIIVTHLEELGRNALDYWDDRHYQLVHPRFRYIAPEIEVSSAYTGDEIFL